MSTTEAVRGAHLEVWEMTPREYQESKAMRAAGVPILNAADGREHERIVRERHESGEEVPERVLYHYRYYHWLDEDE